MVGDVPEDTNDAAGRAEASRPVNASPRPQVLRSVAISAAENELGEQHGVGGQPVLQIVGGAPGGAHSTAP